MRASIDLSFRPSLLIFADEAGAGICKQFKNIVRMAGLDETLHQGVALIQVSPDGKQGKPIPIGEKFPGNDIHLPTEPDNLDLIIGRALHSIRLVSRLKDINDAGYPDPETRPQVYIIGDIGTSSLVDILEMVHKQIAERHFSTLICYVLSAYDQQAITTSVLHVGRSNPLLLVDEAAYWKYRGLTNFCYLYEDQLTYPTPKTVTLEDSHYAAAEALFALVATGMTPGPAFKQYMELPPNQISYSNVGSLGTSLILFPRDSLLEFCSARLSSTLMGQWLSDINRELLPEKEHSQQLIKAQKNVQAIEQWIRDRYPRPFAGERKQAANDDFKRQNASKYNWPSLSILTQDYHPISPQMLVRQQIMLRDYIARTETLFKLFWTEDVEKESRKYKSYSNGWLRLVYQHEGQAVEAYHEWDKFASRAWEAASERVLAELKLYIDNLWSNRQYGIHGFEVARTYAEEFDEQLTKLQNQLIRLRETHERDYRERMDTFEQLSDGEWLSFNSMPGGSQNRFASTGAPTVKGQVAAAGSSVGNGPAVMNAPGVPTQAGSAAPQHLPAREEQIAAQLEQRVLWFQDQIPSVPTQITISFPFVLALVFSGLALFPQLSTMYFAIFVLGVTLLVAVANWLFWKRYRKRVKDAQEDLLKFYRCYYAHKCEQREDALRRTVMVPLRMRILRIRERLADIWNFIEDVQSRQDKRACDVRQEMFSSPSAVRDIYVANGERLQKDHGNTVQDFEEQVTRLREKFPVQEWHRSYQDMKEGLIESFRQHKESIIEMNEEDAEQHIYEFSSNIIRDYFKGSLVDIKGALANAEVWKDALDMAQSPLYASQAGLREPQLLFACGQQTDIRQGEAHLPMNTTPVYISDRHDWVLMAALFKGGTPAAFNPDTLFALICPSCKVSNPGDAIFCTQCGTKFS
jgi:hypothetical protein